MGIKVHNVPRCGRPVQLQDRRRATYWCPEHGTVSYEFVTHIDPAKGFRAPLVQPGMTFEAAADE